MTRCVTKAAPLQFIDGNILKSRITCLTNPPQPISHHITPLVINTLGSGHTDRHTHTYQHMNTNNFKKPGAHSLRPRTRGLIEIECLFCTEFIKGNTQFICQPASLPVIRGTSNRHMDPIFSQQSDHCLEVWTYCYNDNIYPLHNGVFIYVRMFFITSLSSSDHFQIGEKIAEKC